MDQWKELDFGNGDNYEEGIFPQPMDISLGDSLEKNRLERIEKLNRIERVERLEKMERERKERLEHERLYRLQIQKIQRLEKERKEAERSWEEILRKEKLEKEKLENNTRWSQIETTPIIPPFVPISFPPISSPIYSTVSPRSPKRVCLTDNGASCCSDDDPRLNKNYDRHKKYKRNGIEYNYVFIGNFCYHWVEHKTTPYYRISQNQPSIY